MFPVKSLAFGPKIIWNPGIGRDLFRFVDRTDRTAVLYSGWEGKSTEVWEFVSDVIAIDTMAVLPQVLTHVRGDGHIHTKTHTGYLWQRRLEHLHDITL